MCASYDDIYRKPERQVNLRHIEEWLPPLLSKKEVLEVPCGTGYWSQFIALDADPPFTRVEDALGA